MNADIRLHDLLHRKHGDGNGDAARFLDVYGARLPQDLRADLLKTLASPDIRMRVLGVGRVCVAICHGADPEHGLPLSLAFLDFLRTHWRTLTDMHADHLHAVCGAAVNACVHVHFIEGKWDTCRALVRTAPRDFPFVAGLPIYFNAIGICALTLLRSNRADEAFAWMNKRLDAPVAPDLQRPDVVARTFRKRFEDIAPDVGAAPDAPRLDQAREAFGEIERFFQARFHVESRRPFETAVREKLNELFAAQVKGLENAQQSLAGMPAHLLVGMDMPRLADLIDKAHALARLANDPAIPFSESYPRVAAEQQQWFDDLSRFINPLVDRDRVNTVWVDAVINRAFGMLAAVKADPGLAAPLMADLAKAHAWCMTAGDVQHAWMTHWIRVLLAEELDDFALVDHHVGVLCQALWTARAAAGDIESGSNVANHLPGLTSKSCKAHDRQGDTDTLMMALELRKSRSLVACDADMHTANEVHQYRQPEALGRRTHYLSYTVLHHEDRIQAMLYTADGRLHTERIALPLDQLRQHVRRLDPDTWRLAIFGPRTPLRAALAPLMAPLAGALDSGRIQPDNHVCIAADDPVNLVPLHYLPLAGQPAVCHLSMSRVASFGDALRLAAHDGTRPAQMSAIFVPSVARDIGAHLAHFRTLAEATAAWIGHCDPTDGALVTRQDILRRLVPHRIVHIHGHGEFKANRNPGIASGLLVSDGKHLPNIDGRSPLLTPRDVLQSGPRLEGSHVTLSACLSGLGLAGVGGDILGMEMALRLCGAASLLATHWQIRSDHAAAFSQAFYQRWLKDGLDRATAWRDSTIFFMEQESDDIAAAGRCAFSLFGTWH